MIARLEIFYEIRWPRYKVHKVMLYDSGKKPLIFWDFWDVDPEERELARSLALTIKNSGSQVDNDMYVLKLNMTAVCFVNSVKERMRKGSIKAL